MVRLLPKSLANLAPVLKMTIGGRSCAEVDGFVQLLDQKVLDPRLMTKLLRFQAAMLVHHRVHAKTGRVSIRIGPRCQLAAQESAARHQPARAAGRRRDSQRRSAMMIAEDNSALRSPRDPRTKPGPRRPDRAAHESPERPGRSEGHRELAEALGWNRGRSTSSSQGFVHGRTRRATSQRGRRTICGLRTERGRRPRRCDLRWKTPTIATPAKWFATNSLCNWCSSDPFRIRWSSPGMTTRRVKLIGKCSRRTTQRQRMCAAFVVCGPLRNDWNDRVGFEPHDLVRAPVHRRTLFRSDGPSP